jgi:argininosuccinate lyase
VPVAGATDLAELLVERGMPFREAHAVVGDLVRRSVSGDGALRDLVASHEALGPDAAALLDPGVPVGRRTTPGGAGPEPARAQLDRFAARLTADRERVS